MTINLPKNSQLSSRTKFFKRMLHNLQMHESLKALNLMIEEMCAEKGFKRSSGAHYYHHLVDVSQKLLNAGIRNETVITVAILHDAIEDVEWINYEYIKREYGEEVANAVQTLTKDPNINYKEDEEALEAYLIKCFSHWITALVKSADRIHNFGTLGATPPQKQLRVALETEANFFPLFKWAREEYPEYAAFFHQAKTEIEPHLEKIKEFAAMQTEYQNEISKRDEIIEELKKAEKAQKTEYEEKIQKLKEEVALSKVEQMNEIVNRSETRKEDITTIHALHTRNKQLEKALQFYESKELYENKEILNDYGRVASKVLNPLSIFDK